MIMYSYGYVQEDSVGGVAGGDASVRYYHPARGAHCHCLIVLATHAGKAHLSQFSFSIYTVTMVITVIYSPYYNI